MRDSCYAGNIICLFSIPRKTIIRSVQTYHRSQLMLIQLYFTHYLIQKVFTISCVISSLKATEIREKLLVRRISSISCKFFRYIQVSILKLCLLTHLLYLSKQTPPPPPVYRMSGMCVFSRGN